MPSTACILAEKLGIKDVAAFDISAACSGFIYALSIAKAYIESGMKKTVLVIGAETLSKITDYTDRTTCVIFGDGAGAVVVSATDKPGILAKISSSIVSALVVLRPFEKAINHISITLVPS